MGLKYDFVSTTEKSVVVKIRPIMGLKCINTAEGDIDTLS